MPTCSAVQPHETASHDTVSATVSSVLLLAGLFVACVFFPIAGSNLHAYQHHIASHRAISPNTHTSVKELRTSGFNGASSLLLTAMRHIEKEFYVSKTNGSTGKQSAGNGAPHIKSAAVETADGKKSSLKNTASKSSVKDEAAVKHVTENDAPEVGPKATAATAKIKISPNDQKVKVARDKLAELYRDKENNLWRIGEHALDTDKELGDGKAIELAKELHIAVGTIANFNISFNTSKVLSFYEGNNVLTMGNTGFTPAEGWIAEVGGEISQFYGYKFLRLYQQSDFTKAPNGANVLKPGIPSYAIKPGYQLSPGDPMYADINGDGKIDDTDRTTLGSPNPKFLGGFSNTLNYQNWSFSFFFKYSFGNKVLNYTSFTESAPGSTWRNMPATYNNRWTGDNTNTTISRLILNGLTDVSTNPGKLSSLYVEDGSFLRLNSVALSYKIPKKLLQKFGVEALGITFSAYNLWTLTNYSGNSPEASTMNVYAPPMGTGYSEITNSTPYSSMTRGYDRNATPRPINVSLAINLKF